MLYDYALPQYITSLKEHYPGQRSRAPTTPMKSPSRHVSTSTRLHDKRSSAQLVIPTPFDNPKLPLQEHYFSNPTIASLLEVKSTQLLSNKHH